MQNTSRAITVVVIALLMPIVPFLVVGELPGERWLSSSDDNALLFAATGGGLLIADVLLPVPSSIVITLLGTRLGLFEGWLCALVSLTAGNLLGYGIGRLWPAKLAPEVSNEPTIVLLIVSRPVPILAEAMAIAAGAARTSFSPTLAACVAGNLVYTGVLAANGATLLADDLTGPGIFLPLFVPVAGWATWRLVGRFIKRAADTE